MYTRFKETITMIPLEDVSFELLAEIASGVCEAVPVFSCTASDERLRLPVEAYNPARRQYNSNIIMRFYRGRFKERTLMVAQVDLYVPGLNFVFGQAEHPGVLALISLTRLNPVFYGWRFDKPLLIERAVKEAVHEIGHTYGLTHCPNPRCVMHFSNSIMDTDFKLKTPCELCMRNLRKLIKHPF